MKKIGLALVAGIAMMTWACEDQVDAIECSGDQVCTEIFVSLVYEPKDGQGNAIILDNYYSQNLDNGNSYNFNEPATANTSGIYQVISDAQIAAINTTGTRIRFFGEKNGEIIIEQDFLVGHDCCHVILIEGPGR